MEVNPHVYSFITYFGVSGLPCSSRLCFSPFSFIFIYVFVVFFLFSMLVFSSYYDCVLFFSVFSSFLLILLLLHTPLIFLMILFVFLFLYSLLIFRLHFSPFPFFFPPPIRKGVSLFPRRLSRAPK